MLSLVALLKDLTADEFGAPTDVDSTPVDATVDVSPLDARWTTLVLQLQVIGGFPTTTLSTRLTVFFFFCVVVVGDCASGHI
jgi:hypothetical protein